MSRKATRPAAFVLTTVSMIFPFISVAWAADTGVVSAGACTQLLGAPEVRARNRRRRQASLHGVDGYRGTVSITHSATWREPFQLEVRGLKVLLADTDRPGGGSAVVALGDELAHLGCPSGRYPVHRDAALGRGIRVLAVLKQGLLVESGKRLAFIAAVGARPPHWRMIWTAPWTAR